LESCSVKSENSPGTKQETKKHQTDAVPGDRAGRNGNHPSLTELKPRLAAAQNFRVQVGLG